MIERVKGTQDVLDLTMHTFILTEARALMQKYGFAEIATPLIEPITLFKRTLGTYTDVVSKEMFCIQPHSEKSEEICLRPEATASTMRAYLQENVSAKPWMVYSHGPCFRYERPQKGRLRQFTQFNIELINGQSIAYDAHLICMLHELFSTRLGLSSYQLKVNFLGCINDRTAYRTLLMQFLHDHQSTICATCVQRMTHNTMRIFDCKESTCQDVYQQAPILTNHLCTTCSDEWHTLLRLLDQQKIPYHKAHALVRGLDYYEKTVFEFVSDLLGAQSTFCGGGRYELASILGASTPVPSLGAAFGFERLVLMLTEQASSLPTRTTVPRWIILPLSNAQHAMALALIHQLHSTTRSITVLFDSGSLKNMLRNANKMCADVALIIGDDEQKSGYVLYKHLGTGEQKLITPADLIAQNY